MNPAAAHRLLNAPTPVWLAYQKDHPHWGSEIASCLRAGTLSPLAATNNLRRLTDCMADPEIQPLLCDWFSKHFIPYDSNSRDASERVLESLSKCVRSLQLQAIGAGHSINILGHTQRLAELAGNPFEKSVLWHSWLLAQDDIYTMGAKNEFFTNGKSLGSKQKLQKTLSQYQKFVVEAMAANPDIAKDLPTHLYINLEAHVHTGKLRMAHALLWEHERLSDAHKQALAIHWSRDTSPWATQAQDRLLSPEKTRLWDALALHAQTYLDVCGAGLIDFHDTVKILETCPPLLTAAEGLDDIDLGVFTDASRVLN